MHKMKKLLIVSLNSISASSLFANSPIPDDRFCPRTKTMTAMGFRWCGGSMVFHEMTETCTMLGITCEQAETAAATCALNKAHEKLDKFFEDYMPGCTIEP
jgi:hypothetical protein